MWTATISLISKEILTIENLVAINQIPNNIAAPIEVIIDFENYHLPLPQDASKIAFLGDSDITLTTAEIESVKLCER